MWRNFTREEEFLRDFGRTAEVAAREMGGVWQPDPDCDDRKRQQTDYFISTGQLEGLVFESAAVFQNESGSVSSAQISLRSAERVVTVRVTDLLSANPKAEKMVDTLTDGSP